MSTTTTNPNRERILDAFAFSAEPLYVSQVAEQLGLKPALADYHARVLVSEGRLEQDGRRYRVPA